jgi:putative endonuclease
MVTKILNSREKGALGEDIAGRFLMKKGYSIVEKNYLKKYGEIDIIALKNGVVNFVEVKSVTGSASTNIFRPEENVHVLKQRRLRRVIQTFLLERGYGLDAEFLFHVIVVRMNMEKRRAGVSFIENIVL